MIDVVVSVIAVWVIGCIIAFALFLDAAQDNPGQAISLALLWPVWAVRAIIKHTKTKWKEEQ